MRVLIALATYNERENLPSLLDEILRTVSGADILIVDDDSPDGTADWVAARAGTETRLTLLRRDGKLGLGTAVVAAIRHAVEHGYDLLVNMDADWSHDPRSIPALIEAANRFDVVLGSRYTRGGRIEGWPLFRRLMSRTVNAYARLMLGLRTKDNSGSFRCYRVDVLRKIDLRRIRSRGYSFFEEILFRLKNVGAVSTEIPITFTDRRFGRSKIDKKEAVLAIWMIFRIGVSSIFDRRT